MPCHAMGDAVISAVRYNINLCRYFDFNELTRHLGGKECNDLLRQDTVITEKLN